MRTNKSLLCVTACLLATGLSARAEIDSPSASLQLARQLNQAFVEVAESVSPTVVVVEAEQKPRSPAPLPLDEIPFWEMLPPELRRHFEQPRPQRPQPRQPMVGRGSGIVISEDGYILTNNHVVEDAERITVRFMDHRRYTAEVRGVDPESDLAVLKIDATGLPAAILGNSAETRVGEFVLAIGAPFDLTYSVTVGHVSAKGRSFENLWSGYLDQDFIQTDARINPGNSGGPLVNLYGEVIGINTMIRGLHSGIGFAIPSNLARTVSERLIEEGRFVRSWIGVMIRELREHQAYRELVPDVEDGVVIAEIVPGGPASRSKLRPADIVTSVDGRQVRSTRELKEAIATRKPGSTITLDVMRNRERIQVAVTTDGLPDSDMMLAGRRPRQPAEATVAHGLTVRPMTHELAGEQDIEMTRGVLVTAVEAGSTAERSGIRPGDIITEVNWKPVANPNQFREALNNADLDRGAVINLVREGVSRFEVLRPDGE